MAALVSEGAEGGAGRLPCHSKTKSKQAWTPVLPGGTCTIWGLADDSGALLHALPVQPSELQLG
jgi:hypothetical protein